MFDDAKPCAHGEVLYHYSLNTPSGNQDVYRCQACYQCFRMVPTEDSRPTLECER